MIAPPPMLAPVPGFQFPQGEPPQPRYGTRARFPQVHVPEMITEPDPVDLELTHPPSVAGCYPAKRGTVSEGSRGQILPSTVESPI